MSCINVCLENRGDSRVKQVLAICLVEPISRRVWGQWSRLLVDCCDWVAFFGSVFGNLLEMGSLGKQNQVCG